MLCHIIATQEHELFAVARRAVKRRAQMQPDFLQHWSAVQVSPFSSTGIACCAYRIDTSSQQADAEDGVQTKHRQPSGLLKTVAVGVLNGIASAMLYQWCMERQRQDNIAWEYYRTH